MNESLKYEVILEELNVLEKQLSALYKKNKELTFRLETMEKSNREVSQINAELNAKVGDLELKIEALKKEKEFLSRTGVQNVKDRENLKIQINELVGRIDRHLSS